ncbi:SRPBCC family protein [Ulvibacter antarcticus]|uniref:Polyketide cyclase/dehydrase/lipid transport protein n=1 Tax=Ulvibacter antarcticus TaxID=442714 RepID=A0A3L9YEK5_9FLAO|nr:SRPBCC family protein [Ulvibacter antarcticus]RMA57897.1 polyketide cyclase/dehydrase/lipid transport protein [Ulvibacter antarcticus]
MKILKYLFFLILIVLIGGAIYFGTKDGNYDITDTKVIKAPAEVVFNIVNDYKTWEEWGPWKKEDSTMILTYAEKTEGEGASYSWKGEMDGSMTTTKVIPNKEIEQDLTLLTPGGERNPKVYWNFEEVEGGTKVTWGMKGEHPLMDKVYYATSDMDFDSQMHEMNQKGLEGLETLVMKKMNEYSINVDGVTNYGGGYYMYNTTSSMQSDVGQKMGPMLGQVSGYMQENNIQMAGMPFTIYNQIDEANGNVIFSACIPVREKIITPAGSPVLCGFMQPITTIKTTLKGKYEHLPEVYKEAKKYIAENNLIIHPTAKMFEVYSTDPGEVPNPANWLTEVYIPILGSGISNN